MWLFDANHLISSNASVFVGWGATYNWLRHWTGGLGVGRRRKGRALELCAHLRFVKKKITSSKIRQRAPKKSRQRSRGTKTAALKKPEIGTCKLSHWRVGSKRVWLHLSGLAHCTCYPALLGVGAFAKSLNASFFFSPLMIIDRPADSSIQTPSSRNRPQR